MSVFNGERFLRESVESVLNQTFHDFEFLIINDGSTDSTQAILESYHDPRIRLIHQQNLGLTRALNMGLRLARGRYVARLDGDDVCLPERLERQINYLDLHTETVVLGAWVEWIDISGNTTGEWRPPTGPSPIRWNLLFGNCIAHSSVVYRREAVCKLGGYDESCRLTQDYDLWERLGSVGKAEQLPEVLIRFRRNPLALSSTSGVEQDAIACRVTQRAISGLLGKAVTLRTVKLLRRSQIGSPLESDADALTVGELIISMYKAFRCKFQPGKAAGPEIKSDARRRLVRVMRSRSQSKSFAFKVVLRALPNDPAFLMHRPVMGHFRRLWTGGFRC